MAIRRWQESKAGSKEISDRAASAVQETGLMFELVDNAPSSSAVIKVVGVGGGGGNAVNHMVES